MKVSRPMKIQLFIDPNLRSTETKVIASNSSEHTMPTQLAINPRSCRSERRSAALGD